MFECFCLQMPAKALVNLRKAQDFVEYLKADTLLSFWVSVGWSESNYTNCKCYGRRQKSPHLPSVQRDGQYRAVSVPFPFNFRAVPFLSVFKPFPFCPKGSPSVLVNGSDSEIKCAWPLIVQEGLRQFGDRDRARARTVCT